MQDTLPDAEVVRLTAIRRLDPLVRLRQALELSDTVRRLAALRPPSSAGSGDVIARLGAVPACTPSRDE